MRGRTLVRVASKITTLQQASSQGGCTLFLVCLNSTLTSNDVCYPRAFWIGLLLASGSSDVLSAQSKIEQEEVIAMSL
jgi:hypothetical protein